VFEFFAHYQISVSKILQPNCLWPEVEKPKIVGYKIEKITGVFHYDNNSITGQCIIQLLEKKTRSSLSLISCAAKIKNI
jgi:hypothetical protein